MNDNYVRGRLLNPALQIIVLSLIRRTGVMVGPTAKLHIGGILVYLAIE